MRVNSRSTYLMVVQTVAYSTTAHKSYILCYNGSMKNKHLEHIEDHVLTGRQGALDAIKFLDTKQSQVSVKYDGAPAIVYGTNPENG